MSEIRHEPIYPHKYIYRISIPVRNIENKDFYSVKEMADYLLNELKINYSRNTIEKRIRHIKNIKFEKILNDNFEEELKQYRKERKRFIKRSDNLVNITAENFDNTHRLITKV